MRTIEDSSEDWRFAGAEAAVDARSALSAAASAIVGQVCAH